MTNTLAQQVATTLHKFNTDLAAVDARLDHHERELCRIIPAIEMMLESMRSLSGHKSWEEFYAAQGRECPEEFKNGGKLKL